MRTMYDSVDANHLPAGGDLYLGYVDGAYRNVDQVQARFPGKRVVTVTVLGGDADVADCENGDLTPTSTVGWVKRQRAAGKDPTVYTMFSEWDSCRAAFSAAGEPEPYWFIAKYDNDPTLIPGAVAKQYGGDLPGNYDASIVADYWPGVDPAPSIPQGDEPMKPAQTPSWCPRQANGAYPQFKSYLDGTDAIVVSVNNAPFTPAWSEGDHGAYTDFVAFGLWCRRFKNAGEPEGFSEQADGAFILNADHGTFDVAHKN